LVTYDTIIRDGRWFDGTGAASAVRNIGVRDGHVVAISPDDLDDNDCPQVIDATGKWVLPGMLDIHSHYDVEALNGPSLSESLRHGVTTVMLGSCSLSTVHVGGVDAGHLRIGDRADIVVIDPERLDATLDDYAEDSVEHYGGLPRMVNRNDDTVNAVHVGGRAVFLDGKQTDLVGNKRTWRFLRAAHKAPAIATQEMEFASVS
jgi:N-acyl-D-aspartate/D-glutamate deacylase